MTTCKFSRTALVVSLLLCAASSAQNLLTNSGFEFGPPGARCLKRWNVRTGSDVFCTRTETGSYEGIACAELRVGPEAQIGFYQLNQSLNVPPGQTVTLSAWVRTKNVRGGAGAYISINFFKRGEQRISYFDSEQKLLGTTGWTRLTVTATVPRAAAATRVILVLHGFGTAWFDAVQLEPGDVATPYQPSHADVLEKQKLKEAQRKAALFFAKCKFRRVPGKNVAILRDDFPKLGAPSEPAVLARVLKKAGFFCTFLDAQALANPSILRPSRFDLLVLPYGPAFPSPARESVQDFLAGGGSFLSMGGYAFDKQLVKGPDGWVPCDKLPRKVGKHAVQLFKPAEISRGRWHCSAPDIASRPKIEIEKPANNSGGVRIKFSVKHMHGWATALSPAIPRERFFKGWSALVFRARGDISTPKFIVEWQERDGARWKTSLDLSTKWREYILLPSDFKYWPDNPSVGRGGPGDHLRLDNIKYMQIGVSTEILPQGGDYTFWIEDVRIADDPYADLRIPTRCMNTRFCKIHDAMFPDPDQIGVFDPSHPLKKAVTARAAALQTIFPSSLSLKGPFEGFAAVGVLSIQGHGFGPDRSRLVPLIESFDRFGRPRGALGSIMFHFSGYYRGSAWAFFGVTNRDLFADDKNSLLKYLPAIVKRLIDKFYLFGSEAEYPCYRAGEKVLLRTNVANFGRESRNCVVRFQVVSAKNKRTIFFNRAVKTAVTPGERKLIEVKWTAPANGEDFFVVRCTLMAADDAGPGRTGKMSVIDEEKNAFIVWRDELVKRGPKIAIRDRYFTFNGKTRYLIGCQNWWGTTGSISQRNVLDWERDFQMMQDLGLHLSRCFLPWRTEREKRTSDAWVYLAQKHGIVMFDAPNLPATADPKRLQQEIATAKEIASRYKDVPGFLIDTCNETGIVANDSEAQRAVFNEFLRQRYKTNDRLKAAWKNDPPERPMPNVPFRWPAQQWNSLRARDVTTFAVRALCDWADALREAFRTGRPDLAVTPGWGQGFGWGARIFDPPLASRHQDFTNQHYYGELRRFPLYLKTLDRRWNGQPWSVGECGARQHPSFPGGETEPEYNRRFLYIHHHAFGMGMSFVATWHWRDPMAGIFPFGKVHADYALREAALVERNQSLLFGHLRPRYEPSEVFVLLPDAHRLTGGKMQCAEAIFSCIDTLLGLHVGFESLCEADLAALPKTCKALVWPTPYCPSDETFERVMMFVEKGGVLLVTGDVCYDQDWQWSKTDRLKRLTGASEIQREYPWMDFQAGQATEVRCFRELASIGTYEGRPGIHLAGPGMLVLGADTRGTVMTLHHVGKGMVVFVGEPIELERDVPRREIYAAFLDLAKVRRLSVQPDRANLHVFQIPGESGGRIIVAYNAGKACNVRVRVKGRELSMHLAAMSPGMCVLDRKGNVVQAEAQGEVSVDGKLVMKSDGHVAAMALDGQALAASRRLLLIPFEPGRIAIASSAGLKDPQAEVGEVSRGKWRAFGHLSVSRADGAFAVDCPSDFRLELIVLATSTDKRKATDVVTRWLVQ